MNAFMNIQVRIITARAQAQIRQLKGEIARLDQGMARGARGARGMEGGFARAMTAGTKFGNQLQWTGRQLQYNFAMPIALATGLAVKFALENEAAMVRVSKVYGDAGQDVEDFGGEIKALERNFKALSNHFGVHRAEVIKIAGDWAAAGATGVALAKATKLTLETMVLGEMQAAEATEALLAVQGQYNLSVQELSQSMDTLNMIENETDTTMAQLITSMARAAGTARQAGVSVQELAAMTAALVPEAGKASLAGNGLKTIISRLLSPTKEAAAVLGQMGLSMQDLDWQSLNVTQRLQTLADAFVKLPEGQRAVVGEYVAGRWQITRFNQLLMDVADQSGDYHKAMNASADATRNYRQRVRELNAVLGSNPQKMKQVKVILENTLADVIVPLLPAIVFLAQKVAQLAQSFANLDPDVQMLVGSLLLFLMLFGPLLRYMGSSITLFATMGSGLKFLKNMFFGTSAAAAASAAAISASASTSAAATAAGGAAMSASTAATGSRMAGIWAATHAAMVNTAKKGWFGHFAQAEAYGTVMVGQHRRLGLFTVSETAGTQSKLGAMWAAFWAKRRAQDSAGGTAEVALRRATGTATVAAEAATASSTLAVRRMMHTMLLGEDGVYRTATTAANAGFHGTIIEGELAAGRARAGARAAGNAQSAASDTSFQAAARAKWAGFWTWMSAGHQTWMLRMAAVGQVGATRMALVESAYLTASRARWSAYWIQLSVMQRGAAAKMVATDAAMKARMGAASLFKFMLNPWVLLTLAVIGIVYHFRDQIVEAFNTIRDGIAGSMKPLVGFFDKLAGRIVEAFYSLPRGVQNAMLAVVRIVHDAAMKVYELFSYLNPFARHSPSLVDNVTAGAAAVGHQYHRMGRNIANALADARRHLAAFKSAAAALGIDEWSDKRLEIAEGLPQMLPLFNTLVADLGRLNNVLAEQERAVAAQQAVVNRWKSALDTANASVDNHQNKLEGLRETLQALQDQYDKHEQSMQNYASAPIKGMGAMSDAIFDNEIAQKKLRLEIMNWEDANGSIDDVRDRLAMLQGDIESSKAEAADLRAAGAGSDILGPIEAEIAAMEKQADATRKAVEDSPVNELQKQLEQLERAGTRLDLENAIKFDPLLRQIDHLANGMKELPYNVIIDGINREKKAMDALTPQIEAATRAVEAQEAATRAATEARDAIQATYDTETAKLDVLQAEYAETADLIRDIESALNDVGSAARDVNERARKAARGSTSEMYAVEKFDMAAAADFADVGGSGNVPREFPEIQDQSALIDEMTRQLTEDTSKLFGEFDMLGPFKRAWLRVTNWWTTSAWPALDPVLGELGRNIKASWDSMFDGKGFEIGPIWDSIVAKTKEGGEKLRGAIKFVTDIVMAVWRLLGPDLMDIFRNVWESLQKAFGDIGREVGKFAELWEPLKTTLSIFWDVIQGIFVVAFAALALIFKTGWSIVAEIVGPILDVISDTIENVLQIIRGIFQTFMALVNGDWKLFAKGIKNIVQGIVDGIWDIFKGAVRIIWGVIKGLVEGIFGFFQWLYKELVGRSIVPDIVNGIWSVFKGLMKLGQWIYDNVIKPVADFFVQLSTAVGATLGFLVGSVFTILRGLFTLARWIWDNVLKPFVGIFTNLWEGNLKGALASLVRLVLNVFTGWNALPKAIWDNVLGPIVSKFAGLWVNHLRPLLNTLLRGIGNVFNAVGEGIAAGVNIGISAINKLIDALNWVGKNVPGLNFTISPIGKYTFGKWTPPQFETGGILPSRVGEGFATSKARAIVGEGRGNHPEYVIPTDPRHRGNALKLYGELGQAIGGWGFDIPGVDIGAAAAKVGSTIRKGAVTAAVAPMMKAFDSLMSGMSDKPEPLKRMIMKAKNNAYDWLRGVNGKIPDVAPPGNVGHALLPSAGWQGIEAFLKANSKVTRYITSTLRPGDRGFHGRGLAIDYSVPGHGNRGYNDPGLRGIFDALLPAAGNLAELILAGAPFNIQNGRKVSGYAWGEPGKPGNHWNHVHAARAAMTTRQGGVQEFAKGGIVHREMQGVIGEAGPELVTPLAPLWARLDRIERQTAQQSSSSGGDVIININGNLEFPNISDGSDAKEFVRNLKIMAR